MQVEFAGRSSSSISELQIAGHAEIVFCSLVRRQKQRVNKATVARSLVAERMLAARGATSNKGMLVAGLQSAILQFVARQPRRARLSSIVVNNLQTANKQLRLLLSSMCWRRSQRHFFRELFWSRTQIRSRYFAPSISTVHTQ